ncbi:nuclear transport factor 2 family protein [Thermogemmatispora carboxidivorans]|uniref:nuclear transport factor 2 family protein n=1 Tax=Thermogemmatispora carboxidivorans TaxID=1382306 RepID=UPI00069A75EB|nr:nuclear transport factor 2 family protein [Thermogemmatispora carboxidivorans]
MRTNRDGFEHGGPTPGGMELPILINRWVVAFNAHDVDELIALYHESAELFDTGMRHARRGHQEIAHWFSQRFSSMPTIQYTPTRRFFGEGQAVVCWIASGKTPRLLKQSWLSRPFQVDGVSIFLVRSGLILRQSDYYDHFAIVEQVFPPLRWLPFRL